jgi:glutathione synthase/RimK-type ligase-like ATP-grasp enzyme
MYILPYKAGSKSALALAKGTESLLIRLEGSKFKPSAKKLVLNWGSSSLPAHWEGTGVKVINHPNKTSRATNKKTFFEDMAAAGVSIPRFTTDKEVARSYFDTGAKMVFARTVLNGHSGVGIVVVNSKEELDAIAPGTLLVEYIPKRHEYRIHTKGDGTVFSIQQKKRDMDIPEDKVNFKIRNHDNGFIFARNDIDVPPNVLEEASKAAKASGLDFGAFDIIYNERKKQPFVLEANTAPGLSGTTVNDYITMIGAIAV